MPLFSVCRLFLKIKCMIRYFFPLQAIKGIFYYVNAATVVTGLDQPGSNISYNVIQREYCCVRRVSSFIHKVFPKNELNHNIGSNISYNADSN